MRVLFSSIHCLLDPSSGAAIATRELLELLSRRGAECRAFTAGVLDYEEETSLDQALGTLGLPAPRLAADLGGGRAAEVVDVEAGGIRCTILPARHKGRGARRMECEAVLLVPSPHRGGGIGRGGDRLQHSDMPLREASPPAPHLWATSSRPGSDVGTPPVEAWSRPRPSFEARRCKDKIRQIVQSLREVICKFNNK